MKDGSFLKLASDQEAGNLRRSGGGVEGGAGAGGVLVGEGCRSENTK